MVLLPHVPSVTFPWLRKLCLDLMRKLCLLTSSFIRYSPIGSGMLSGQFRSADDLAPNDARRYYPRFQAENFPINLELVKQLETLAKKKGCTSSQLAINWVKGLSKKPGMPTIIPIPGATTEARVRENAQDWELTNEELSEIDDILAKFKVSGNRYPDGIPIDG